MLVATGTDLRALEQICSELGRRGRDFRRMDAAAALAERGNLFMLAVQAQARGIVVVEPVQRVMSRADKPDDALLDAALAATSAPGMRLLVLVTHRTDDDPGLRKLRSDGVPYVVVRPAPVFEITPPGVVAALRGRAVLMPSDVVAATAGAVPLEALCDAAIVAVEDGSVQGRVLAVAPSREASLQGCLERAGARPKVVDSWRVRLGSWFGQPIARRGHRDDEIQIVGATAPVAAAADGSMRQQPATA